MFVENLGKNGVQTSAEGFARQWWKSIPALCVACVGTTQAAGTPSQVRTKFAKPWKWCGGLNIVRMGKISTNKFSRARDENGKDREDPPLSGGIGG